MYLIFLKKKFEQKLKHNYRKMPKHSSKQATRRGRNDQQTPEEQERIRLINEARRQQEEAERQRLEAERQRLEAERQRLETRRQRQEARRLRDEEARRAFEAFLATEMGNVPIVAPAVTLPPGGIAFQVHNAFNTINKEALLSFFKKATGRDITITESNNSFVRYIKETINNFISLIKNTNTSRINIIRNFDDIFSTLEGIDYTPEYKKLIKNSLEFVKLQPDEFKINYVSNFTYDCAHAYNYPSGRSCAKGMIERFVFSLVPAATLFMERPEYITNHYDKLISIIQNKPQSTSARSLINQLSQNCYNESPDNVEGFRDCIKRELQSRLAATYNEAEINTELNNHISILGLYGGGKHRRITRRKRKSSKKTYRRR